MNKEVDKRQLEEGPHDDASLEALESQPEEQDPTAALQGRLEEIKDLLQRRQAEFENYRKRVRRERQSDRISAKAEVFREILPVLDACEKGLENMPESDDALFEGYRQGYELLYKQLVGLLESHGVETVPGPGHRFDPTLHEAVMREESHDLADDAIIEEFRKGYFYQGHLLRPSQVKVAVAAAEKTGPEPGDDGSGKITINIEA